MDDDLVPHELKGSPYLFQSLFCQKEPNNLKMLALEGHLYSIKNRFLSWRVFLDLLPSSGTAETWLTRAQDLRSSYSSLVRSHTVKAK